MARKRSTSPAEEPAAELLPAQPTAIEVAPAMPTRHDLVDPTVPAGLARISDGSQERFIWPVHLSGWQQQGWTLIATAAGVQITPQPTAPAEVIEAALAAATPEPSSSEASTAAGEAASWELESSAAGEALLLDDPLL
ncbi:hypothetical protein KBZ14_12555 [Synechococcus sp. HJ21-Hayes]|jgi:hypothetical protein|uniref:hypothetical protein n=1 Tax=unclassified Synechococcus TaxID=2626047 RepID=UPI0020CCF73A|nr:MULTISPECIES: hypothetical protein [unclassified Synechococcus]MCP9832136.1 hypothetical protein [Synechococcus sp. JJ3a-Johnson]MCP9853692.1 hypothetical protein [Synechococcus sp. HJ21-Hayes]